MSGMNSRREVAERVAKECESNSYVRGNFTISTLRWHDYTGLGVSKRNPADKPDALLGERIAYGRALKDLVERVWQARYCELYEAGWISPGIPGTIGGDGAGSRLAQWQRDCAAGLATDDDYGKDLTPILKPVSWAIWG
jgi:hypothetical protein